MVYTVHVIVVFCFFLQILKLRMNTLSSYGTGKVITHLSTDVEKFIMVRRSNKTMHDFKLFKIKE